MEPNYRITPANPEHLTLLPEIERSAAAIFPPELFSSEQIGEIHSLYTPLFTAHLFDKLLSSKDMLRRQHFGILEFDLTCCYARRR